MQRPKLDGQQRRERDLLFGAIETIATREGDDPTCLPPLYETIDVELVESLLESGDDSVSVSFTHLGYTVEVRGDGTYRVDGSSGPVMRSEA